MIQLPQLNANWRIRRVGYAVAVALCTGAWSNETPCGIAWTHQIGSTAIDFAKSIALNADSNVFICGITAGDMSGSRSNADDAFLAKFSSDGSILWTRQIGTNLEDDANSLAVDVAGDILVCGHTSGDFGGPNAGLHDAFIAKYSANGMQVWIRQIGTSTSEYGHGVDVDENGNAYMSGYTRGNLAGPSAGLIDAFLVAYSPEGNPLWTRQLGSNENDYAYSTAVDNESNVFICGETGGNLGAPSAGGADAFIAKYSNAGTLLWTNQICTSSEEYADSVAIDAQGNGFISGWTRGSLVGQNAGGYDAFVGKFSSEGNLLWVLQFGTSEYDRAWSIVTDDEGNAFAAGGTEGSVAGPNAGSLDVFILKVTASGHILIARQFGTSRSDRAQSVALNNSGELFAAGHTSGSFGGMSAGSSDAFVSKFFLLPTPRLGDLDRNGTVDTYDLLEVLNAWGDCNEPCSDCVEDLTNMEGTGTDCTVNVFDLFRLLAAWSDCDS